MKKLNIKKDDTVIVITGKDKGVKGKVLVSLPKEERVIVQNANMMTRHQKPRRQGDAGGRIKQEGAIHASNVMLICPKCSKPTRVGHAFEGEKKVRVCKKCGKSMD
ncbi:MAG TPA: 50S ribosomal protein L24 [Clostridia bacterium]|nr:50S ribosomal protein L24 [Clostridia bacterium]HOR12818.1 50S ribosomal protein L24 [Clostridia bacterium]